MGRGRSTPVDYSGGELSGAKSMDAGSLLHFAAVLPIMGMSVHSSRSGFLGYHFGHSAGGGVRLPHCDYETVRGQAPDSIGESMNWRRGSIQLWLGLAAFWLAGLGFAFVHAYSQLDILRPNHWGVTIIVGPPLLLLMLSTFIGRSAK